MHEKLLRYASKASSELLQLKSGEDLFINTEPEHLFFARMVKDAALRLTHRSVTIVILKGGRPYDTAVYDPEDFTLPDSAGKVMLHLLQPARSLSPAADFGQAARDMRLMMDYGHVAEPVFLDRRIAVPWCTLTCYGEDDTESWEGLLSRVLRLDAHADLQSCSVLNNLNVRSMDVINGDCRLTLSVHPGSFFCQAHTWLSPQRHFFQSENTDFFMVNLDSHSCHGEVLSETNILGNRVDALIRIDKGKLLPDPMQARQRLFSRFFLIEDSLNRLSSVRFSGNELHLTFGPGILDSLRVRPQTEEELDPLFNAVFKLDVRVLFERIEGTLSDGRSVMLSDGKTRLF